MGALDVRATIREALEDAGVDEDIGSARLTAFELGDGDVPMDSIELDSVTRMELLVALEMSHEVTVEPGALLELTSLGALAEHVAAREAGGGGSTPRVERPVTGDAAGPLPRPVQHFQRVHRPEHSVTITGRTMQRFGSLWTPREFEEFERAFHAGQVLTSDTPPPIFRTIAAHIDQTRARMDRAGKSEAEPYSRKRLAPAVTFFHGPGDLNSKTLLVCFSPLGGRNLAMPQSVLLQHLDVSHVDVIMLADLRGRGFRTGAPGMGRSVGGVIEWLARTLSPNAYASLRTIGYSAGAYPAMLAGRALGAEVAVSIAGRFPSERHVLENAEMLLRSLRSGVRGRGTRTLFPYQADRRGDRAFARRLARLTGGHTIAMEMEGRDVDHNVIEPMLEHGELLEFFRRTVFAQVESDSPRRSHTTMRFPLERRGEGL